MHHPTNPPFGDRVIRVSTALTVAGLGGIAAYISYRHAYQVAAVHGETGATGRLLPLTVDGLVFVASMVMLDAARRGQSAPRLAMFALGLGIAATVAANVLHGIAHGPIGAVISAWPAVCLVVVVELLMGMIRRGRSAGVTMAGLLDHEAPTEDAVLSDALDDTPAALLAWLKGEDVPAVPPAPDPHQVHAASIFAEEVRGGEVPGIRTIKKRLRIGQDRAQEVRAYLAVLAENRPVPAEATSR